MRKQGSNQRAFHEEQGVPKPRLLQSNGRRYNNNKITIYSHKYVNLMSAQSLPEQSTRYTTSASLLRSDNGSTKAVETPSKQFSCNEKYSQYNRELNSSTNIDEQLLAKVQEKINTAKGHYEAKMREMLDANAKVISELRQILFQQQKQLTDKQKIIQQLLTHRGPFQNKSTGMVPACNHKKLKLGEYEYLKDRVSDLEAKLKLVLNEFGNGDEEVSMRLSRLENQLIRYNGTRLTEYRFRLEQILSQLTDKIEKINNLAAHPSKVDTQNVQSSLCKVQSSVEELKRQLSDFNHKEWAYESSSIGNLQKLLFSINSRIGGSPVKKTNSGTYFIEDDDEFFYPQTDRPYSSTEDYEHFQEDSEQEGDKKQNCSPNQTRSLFKNFA